MLQVGWVAESFPGRDSCRIQQELNLGLIGRGKVFICLSRRRSSLLPLVFAPLAERWHHGRRYRHPILPMIQVPTTEIQTARRFLARFRFEKNSAPALRHVLASIEDGGLVLAVGGDDLRLEYRIPDATICGTSARFLIPAGALRDAAEGGRRALTQFAVSEGVATLEVVVTNRGRDVRTVHPTIDAGDFPDRPVVEGRTISLPKETIEAIRLAAPFAETSPAHGRGRICGVQLSPDCGGVVIATDVRQLAMLPARVPEQPFLLPNAAVRALIHKSFSAGSLEVSGPGDGWVRFSSGHLTCFARIPPNEFPDAWAVFPERSKASATIADADVAPLVAWLRSLKGALTTVQVAWDRPGCVTLTARGRAGVAVSTFDASVETTGNPLSVRVKPAHLANALVIGNTIQIAGPAAPCVVTNPAGGKCVFMALRE